MGVQQWRCMPDSKSGAGSEAVNKGAWSSEGSRDARYCCWGVGEHPEDKCRRRDAVGVCVCEWKHCYCTACWHHYCYCFAATVCAVNVTVNISWKQRYVSTCQFAYCSSYVLSFENICHTLWYHFAAFCSICAVFSRCLCTCSSMFSAVWAFQRKQKRLYWPTASQCNASDSINN